MAALYNRAGHIYFHFFCVTELDCPVGTCLGLCNWLLAGNFWSSVIKRKKLAATLRGSRPGCNPHRSVWRHWWRHNSETIRDREKRRPLRRMKSSELSNAGNRITLRQLLQNRKWRHLWCHSLGSGWKLQKMTRENFSFGAFYNITKNQDSRIKTVWGDSFLSPKPPKNTSF